MRQTSFLILSLLIFAAAPFFSGCAGSFPVSPKGPASSSATGAPADETSNFSDEQLPTVGSTAALSQPAVDTPQLPVANPAASTATESTEEALAAPPDPEPVNIQANLDNALVICQSAQDFWHKGELDNALQALDDAYALIAKTDTSENAELDQQKEDLRFLISKRILEIYASRHIVVNGNHKAIPVTINKHVEAELKRFTGSERKFFRASYQRSGRYRPYIVAQLKEAGLPESLSWLPLIESGYKPRALSKARALGLWQFIPSTGYKFGLKRDVYIDQRLDPVKSTDAAIAYLKELHQIFGDWTTVLAAYNCGEGRVLRVIRSQNVNYLDDFWDLYQRLPWETARYVPRFLATLHIVNNPEKYGLTDIRLDPPVAFETVDVARRVHLKNIAPHIDVSYKELKTLNPELRYQILPPETYGLKVPPGKGQRLLAEIDKIPATSPPQKSYAYHRVRSGQSLSTIAARYKTNVRAIARANNINRHNFIVAGKRLKIPLRGSTTYASAKKTLRTEHSATTHTVRQGDSLWIIARRYGTTTKRIQDLNGLTGTNLAIGQRLKLPGYQQKKTADNKNMKPYRVVRGDSPFSIASKHDMPLEQFLSLNRLSARSKIYPGQQLYVK